MYCIYLFYWYSLSKKTPSGASFSLSGLWHLCLWLMRSRNVSQPCSIFFWCRYKSTVLHFHASEKNRFIHIENTGVKEAKKNWLLSISNWPFTDPVPQECCSALCMLTVSSLYKYIWYRYYISSLFYFYSLTLNSLSMSDCITPDYLKPLQLIILTWNCAFTHILANKIAAPLSFFAQTLNIPTCNYSLSSQTFHLNCNFSSAFYHCIPFSSGSSNPWSLTHFIYSSC